MSDGFAELIDEANAFFVELAANNTKDWFEPRKEHYKTAIQKPAGLLADLIAEDLSRLTGQSHRSKVFRIHRDVRFSKDKTPYNAHLHMMWSPSQTDNHAVWFFGAAPSYLTVGAGRVVSGGEGLARFRAFVDQDGDALADAIEVARRSVGAEFGDWGPPPLKRVPKPYDADHRHADLLKRKGLTLTAQLPEDWRDAGVIAALGATFKGLYPVWSLLDAAA